MNFKLILNYQGKVLGLLAVLMLLPLAVSLGYRDFSGVRAFLLAISAMLLVYIPLSRIRYNSSKLYAKEGLVIVAAAWFAISIFGALPYLFSGQITGFINCLFESVSGFTTTGASVVGDVVALSRGLLFWRSFTNWIGGMGVLVFLMAIIPAVSGERIMYVMKAEAPGPSPGKLVPRIRQSSKILYIIYLAMTVLEIILLAAGGMPIFDSVLNSMATAGTGGFSIISGTMSAYNSLYLEMVIAVFMLLFGINFNLYYLLLLRQFKSVLKSEELRVYLGVIAASTIMIAVNIMGAIHNNALDALRYAFFQVSSFMTTTGFISVDFSAWPEFSKAVLFVLMFVGGCSGSTAGGLKISRVIIMFKECGRSLGQIVRPRSVELVKMDGKPVDKSVVQTVCSYGVLCAIIYFATVLILSLENFDMQVDLMTAAAAINNVGAGFGQFSPGAPPNGGVDGFSALSKLTLCLNMLLGRLEVYPVLLLFAPRTWKKV